MLDKAFETLKTYDWGSDPNALKALDAAVVETRGDSASREALEKRLAELLDTDISRDAKQVVCRKLRVVGTAASVPALAKLLPQVEHSHMARYALQSIPAPEAAAALRDALPKVSGEQKVGVIGSLGVRQDTASVPALKKLVGDSDPAVARSAAHALGAIRTPEAAKALTEAKPNDDAKPAVTDASLACAEGLLANGKKAEALAIYKKFAGENQPKHVRLAATRGMLAGAGK